MHGRQQAPPRSNDNSGSQLVPVASLPVSKDLDLHAWPQAQIDTLRQEPDLGQALRNQIKFVRKYSALYITLCMCFLTGAWIYTVARTPLYTATVRIQIDRAAQEILKSSTSATIKTSAGDYLRTQYALLSSRTLAERVAAKLSLSENRDFLQPRYTSLRSLPYALLARPPGSSQQNPSDRKTLATNIVSAHVEIRPVPGSRLLDIRYRDPNSATARDIANAYANAYIQWNLDKRLASSGDASTFLTDQIIKQRKRLETSEKALLEFAKKSKIIPNSNQVSIAEESLSAANRVLGKLISQRIKDEQLWRQIEGTSSIQMPQFLSNATIDQLRSRRKALANSFQEKLETFKPEYPAMRQIQSKINEVDRQLNAEIKTIRASFKAAFQNSANQESEMRARMESLRSEVLNLKNNQIQYDILQRETDSNRTLYNELLKRLKETNIAGSARSNNIFIVDHAKSPGAPSEPRRGRILLLALLLGIGASTLIAYTIELLDDRVHGPNQAEQVTGLASIASIPNIQGRTRQSKTAASTAYRSLATALQFTTHSGLPRSVAITSTGPNEGKSTTCVALARHFATLGFSVLLIDGDMQQPSLHTTLKAENWAGLSSYLAGVHVPAEIIQPTDQANLSLIAAGPADHNAKDKFADAKLHSLIAASLEAFELVIVDTPSVKNDANAMLITSATAATLFVIACNQQRSDAIRDAVSQLHLARSRLLGTVLTKHNSKEALTG